MIGMEEWFSLISFIYLAIVITVAICLLVLAFRFVGAIERFVEKYNPR